MAVPNFEQLLNPLLSAVHSLGGSATVSEIEEKVAEALKLTEADLAQIHRGNRTRFSYLMGWARSYLKVFGVLENSARGVWSLTDRGRKMQKVDPAEVVKLVQSERRIPQPTGKKQVEVEGEEESWREELIERLLKLPPATFEKLCQRLLRESGFTKVEVTGRTGDGGIDGKGIMRMGGLLSFHVVFQCKRFSGSVPCGAIRDFRGATIGRADKGIFITTGTFTRDAIREAGRDGAPHIDLVDGEQLADKMRELGLGIKIESKTEEVVRLDGDWFKSL